MRHDAKEMGAGALIALGLWPAWAAGGELRASLFNGASLFWPSTLFGAMTDLVMSTTLEIAQLATAGVPAWTMGFACGRLVHRFTALFFGSVFFGWPFILTIFALFEPPLLILYRAVAFWSVPLAWSVGFVMGTQRRDLTGPERALLAQTMGK